MLFEKFSFAQFFQIFLCIVIFMFFRLSLPFDIHQVSYPISLSKLCICKGGGIRKFLGSKKNPLKKEIKGCNVKDSVLGKYVRLRTFQCIGIFFFPIWFSFCFSLAFLPAAFQPLHSFFLALAFPSSSLLNIIM